MSTHTGTFIRPTLGESVAGFVRAGWTPREAVRWFIRGRRTPDGRSWETWSAGMTLRDYFAASALTSMTIAPDYSKGPCNAAMAERAYLIADHMLAERAKTNQPAGPI